MAAEKTEFSVEATPVFDDEGGQFSPSSQAQRGEQAARGNTSPQPNIVQPNVSGQSSPAAPEKNVLTGDSRADAAIEPSLPLDYAGDLFSDLDDEDDGFDLSEDYRDTASSATDPTTATPALLINQQSGARHEIRDLPFVIGRDANCDLVLDDAQVAPMHAEVFEEAGRLTLRSLASGDSQDHALEVNGASVDQAVLALGDSVRIGGIDFEFQSASSLADVAARDAVHLNDAYAEPEVAKSITSFMRRVGKQWMFLVPLVVLGYAGYVLVDTYFFEPAPKIAPQKGGNQNLGPAQQEPLDATMQSKDGGIHFTLGDSGVSAQAAQPAATRQSLPGAAKTANSAPSKPQNAPAAPVASEPFNYENLFNAGEQRPQSQKTTQKTEPATSGAVVKQGSTQSGGNAKLSGGQWPAANDPLEGDLLEGELLEGELVTQTTRQQPSFESQVGTDIVTTTPRSVRAQTGWPRDTRNTADPLGSSNSGRVRIDVPVSSQPAPPGDFARQQPALDAARSTQPETLETAPISRPDSVDAVAQVAEDLFNSSADTSDSGQKGFYTADDFADEDSFETDRKPASDDPFMDMIEERLADLEREQQAKVEAARKSAQQNTSNQASAQQQATDLALLTPPRADSGQPLDASAMLVPPTETEYRPGPSMPLPADRLDKSQNASAFEQPLQLDAAAVEAAARDLVLQSELIYKEDGAKKLLDDLTRLSQHPEVSDNLKMELVRQYEQFSELYRLYTQGQKDFALGAKEAAFGYWVTFLNTEKNLIPSGTSRYAAEVRGIVAQEYVDRAKNAEINQNWPQAWRYWNAAKKFGMTGLANEKIRVIEDQAQQLFDQGIDMEATDPIAARKLWQRVMSMLPEQHALHGQASAKVQWYDQWRY